MTTEGVFIIEEPGTTDAAVRLYSYVPSVLSHHIIYIYVYVSVRAGVQLKVKTQRPFIFIFFLKIIFAACRLCSAQLFSQSSAAEPGGVKEHQLLA